MERFAANDVAGLLLVGEREVKGFVIVCVGPESGVVLRCERKDLGARNGKISFEGEDDGSSSGGLLGVEVLVTISR